MSTRRWLCALVALSVVPAYADLVQTVDDFHVGTPDGRPAGWDVAGFGGSAKLTWLSEKPGAMRVEYKVDTADAVIYLFHRARLRLKPLSFELAVKGNGETLSALIRNGATGDLFEYRAANPVPAGGWATFTIDCKAAAAHTGSGKFDVLPGGGGSLLEGLMLRAPAGATGQLDFRQIDSHCRGGEDSSAMVDLLVNRPDGVFLAGEAPLAQALVTTISEERAKPKITWSLTDATGKAVNQGDTTVDVQPVRLARVPLDIPAPLPCGHYTLKATIDSGKSTRNATLRFIVVPPTPAEGRRLGVTVTATSGTPAEWVDPWLLATLKRAGAGWARLELRWADAERTQGQRDFALLDHWVAASKWSGLPLVVHVADPPAWFGSKLPLDTDDLANFLSDAATHAAGQVLAWEIWRQPNYSRFWPPAPQPYGLRALLTDLSGKIKAVDAKTRVINGGLRGWDPNFVSTLLFNNGTAERPIDRLGLDLFVPRNPYPELDADQGPAKQLATTLPAAYAWMKSPGRAFIAPWVVDCGVRTSPEEESKLPQAMELARCAALAQGFGGYLSWHRAMDGDDKEDRFGLLRRDLEPKPSLATFAAAAAGGAGLRLLSAARAPQGAFAWLLKAPDGFAAMAVAANDADLPPLEGVKISDAWGNPVDAGTARLGPSPLYFTGPGVVKAFPPAT
jgi:hypothetical protein